MPASEFGTAFLRLYNVLYLIAKTSLLQGMFLLDKLVFVGEENIYEIVGATIGRPHHRIKNNATDVQCTPLHVNR